MGGINIVPIFGQIITFLFPLTLILFTFLNIFDFYRIVINFFDIKDYGFVEQIDYEKLDEGKRLLYKYRVERERKYLNLKTTDLK